MFRNKTVFVHTVITLLLSQIIFWLVFFNRDVLPPEIPLWFLQPWGEAQLASYEMIWILPGLAIGILAIDLFITALIYRLQPFLVGIVMTMSTLSVVFLLIATLNVFSRVLGWF